MTISVASSVLPQRVLVNLTQELQDLVETHPNVLEAELNGVPEDLIFSSTICLMSVTVSMMLVPIRFLISIDRDC